MTETPDIHTATGAYAAHALPPEERQAFEAHLLVCAACAQEVRELQATAARLGAASAVTPSAELRARVLAEVARTRQLPPSVAGHSPARAARRWWRTPLAAAAAVLLVAAVGLGGLLVQRQHQLDAQRRMVAEITRVLTDPARTVSTAAVSTGGTGTVVAAGGEAVFVASGLRSLDGGRTYQLWVVAPSGIRSAGLIGRGGDGVQSLVHGVGPGVSVAVSVEPDGGSKQPTTKPILLVPVRT